MIKQKKLKLLSPAGNADAFFAAVNNGADAVYLGLSSFSARRNADNFTLDNLQKYLDYAHALGVEVYVAVNILVKQNELEEFLSLVKSAYSLGADVFILQDMYLGAFLKQQLPNIRLMLSTQGGVCNCEGATLAKQNGFEIVVLARETPLAEISAISEIIDTEAFVQGALCTCFSGQCYFSGFVGGNSGNRGLCKQPCRQKYLLAGKDKYDYALSLSDLCVGSDIDKLIEAGVTSFKIEGRMRRSEYVAAATSFYRNILDNNRQNGDFSALSRTYNRGNYTKGLTMGDFGGVLSNKVQNHLGEKLGTVTLATRDKIVIKCRHNPEIGDAFKILRNGFEVGNAVVREIKKVENGFYAHYTGYAKVGDSVNITTDTALNKRILENKKNVKVDVEVVLRKGDAPLAQAVARGIRRQVGDSCVEIDFKEDSAQKTVTVRGKYLLEEASNQPVTADQIRENFFKVDEYPFEIDKIKVQTDNVFLPKSKLNALRRELYAALFGALSAKNLPSQSLTLPRNKKYDTSAEVRKTAVIARDFSFLAKRSIHIALFFPDDYRDTKAFEKFFTDAKNCEKYLYLPCFMTQGDIDLVTEKISSFDGVYSEGYFGIELAKKLDKKLFCGVGMHIFNSVDANALSKSEEIALSHELTREEQQGLASYCDKKPFVLTAGSLRLMTLLYCPFGHDCKNCNRGDISTLTDESKRTFFLRRYRLTSCRFEVYNCDNLLGETPFCTLIDSTLLTQAQIIALLDSRDDPVAQKKLFARFTFGHASKPVL